MFQSPLSASPPAPAKVPRGAVVWAVGDVHGRADLLQPLLATIAADCRTTEGPSTVVFLGDYIDRGPASDQVLDLLAEARTSTDFAARFLRGNHEDALLRFLRDGASGSSWFQHGGRETLWAYGLRPPALSNDQSWASLAADLAHRLPPAHLGLLGALEFSVTIGDYFFAHAGARPGVALERQDPKDLLWIREAFTGSPRRFNKIVVHGHTPAADVYIDERRIGLDTGAYVTGVLSALRLEGDSRRIVQAIAEPDGVSLRQRIMAD